MKNILLINGPNLNLLGTREPQIYGADTLADVERRLIESAAGRGVAVQCFQSNSEGGLVDRIHAARDEGVDAVIINAGAYTHTSVAIRDALAGVAIPCRSAYFQCPPPRTFPSSFLFVGPCRGRDCRAGRVRL